tara:strand:+ start:381 stop:728 length:348 start_codon:yes stop_codon:yes gene_type:complete
MSDIIDIVSDWLDGLIPGLIVFVNRKITLANDLKSKKSTKILGYIVKILYLLFTIFHLAYMKLIKKEESFAVSINTKIITSCVSVIAILFPLFKLIFKKSKKITKNIEKELDKKD